MQKMSKDNPFYLHPVYRLPPKAVNIPVQEIPGNMDINSELNTDFEENLPL